MRSWLRELTTLLLGDHPLRLASPWSMRLPATRQQKSGGRTEAATWGTWRPQSYLELTLAYEAV